LVAVLSFRKNLPLKSKNPKNFTIPITISALSVDKSLLDLGASINLIPLVMMKKIGYLEIKNHQDDIIVT